MAKKKYRKKKTGGAVFALVLVLILVSLYFLYDKIPAFNELFGNRETESNTDAVTTQKSPEVVTSGDLSIHFLELGNKYTGDCTYIKAGETDILIDAGSRTSSIPAITSYLNQYVTDGKLEYVIVTHAHQDHYAGFATSETTDSIFDLYECEVIIDFARTNQKSDAAQYNNYLRERSAEIEAGATHYTAAECITEQHDSFPLADGISLQILDSYYYYNKSSSENNYSVCCMIMQGENRFLFTGDLEAEGEEKLVEMNELSEVVLYKAGHHGSKTSSSEALLSVIRPEIVCVCCCCGSPEYTDVNENQFPTQDFIDRIAPYTWRVYVTTLCIDYKNNQFTSMNGTITVHSNADGVNVTCSASDLPLYKSEWFQNHRTCPDAWKNAG